MVAGTVGASLIVRWQYEIFHVFLVQLGLLKVENLGLGVAIAPVEDRLGHGTLHVDQLCLLLGET